VATGVTMPDVTVGPRYYPAAVPDAASLMSVERLVGAALALGAERVGEVSSPERELVRRLDPIRPGQRERRQLRDRIRDGDDPLGDAFCTIRSARERRNQGATYTPRAIIDAMVEWSAQGAPPTRVIDPGAGSARFTIAAGRRFPRAELVAVELDPLPALLARANLATQGLERRARVVVSDYRRFGGTVAGRTLYIGNPPYVRHHKIASEWKMWLSATARTHGLTASQLAGLHVHFFLATAAHAKRGDRGVFITAAEWLDVNYGSLVRELLLDGLGGQAIHVIAPDAQPFDDAQTTGAITCFAVGARPSSVRLRRVKAVRDLGALNSGQPVHRDRLIEARRWTPLLRAARKVPEGHIELGELCRVHRGAVTGANKVFVVDPIASDLPAEVLFRTVTRARELFAAGEALSSGHWLRAVVDLPTDLDALNPSERRPVERFIRAARRLGVHEGYVARHRRAWWTVGLREPAPILATYMARRPPAIVRNFAAARHINIAHGLYPRERLSADTLDLLAEALRSSISVTQGRTYAGGLTKFEPREMERLVIPNVLSPAAT
jgi:adenine-specific DNA-methyltransferase